MLQKCQTLGQNSNMKMPKQSTTTVFIHSREGTSATAGELQQDNKLQLDARTWQRGFPPSLPPRRGKAFTISCRTLNCAQGLQQQLGEERGNATDLI